MVLRTILSAPKSGPMIVAPATERALQLCEMRSLATRLGYVCMPMDKLRTSLAHAIAIRLRNRMGSYITQSVAFSLDNFPLDAAKEILPEAHMLDPYQNGTHTWRFESMECVASWMRNQFPRSRVTGAGASRALRSRSEQVIRVLATMMAGLEISHVVLQTGVERLYADPRT